MPIGRAGSGLRSRQLVVGLSLISLVVAGRAAAQSDACRSSYQDETIHWIASGSVGSVYDLLSRVIAPRFAEALGARIVVDNLRGGSGLVALRGIMAGGSDGTTVGLIGGAQAVLGAMNGRLPDPVTDLTLLGEVGRVSYVWATGEKSGIRSMDDVFRIAGERPLVVGIYEPAGATFTRVVVMASLLGLGVEFVPGYRRSGDLVMAAIRGEVDLIPLSIDGKGDRFSGGDLRAVLRLSDGPVPDLIRGVPAFDGPEGLALRRAEALGRSSPELREDVEGIAAFGNIGRLVVAPKETDPSLVPCLREALRQAYAGPQLQRDLVAAGLTPDFFPPEAAIAGMDRGRRPLGRFQPEVERAVAGLRE